MSIRFIILFILALITGVIAFFVVPNPIADPERILAGHIAMGTAVAICLLQLSALWYFLASLKTFKSDLRKAYYELSAGLLILSLAQLQLPFAFIIASLPLAVVYVLVLSPFLLGPLVMSLGVRRFAKLLQVRSVWARMWVAIGIALIGSIIPTLMQLIVFKTIDPQSAIIYGFVTWGGGFALVGGMLAFKIRDSLSPAYSTAMKHLGIAMLALAFSCLHEVIARGTLGVLDATMWYAQFNFSVWPFLVTAALMLWSALSFRQVTKQYAALSENASELDTVISVSQLASIPAQIDIAMDKVRAITASRSVKEFTAADKKVLVDVYFELESYLVNKEPLRKITRDDLRSILPAHFKQLLSAEKK